MIRYECNNIEQYSEHIKDMDIKFTQLKKCIFHTKFWQLNLENIQIQYTNWTISYKAEGALSEEFYSFVIMISKDKQIFNGCEIDDDSIIVIEPKKSMERVGIDSFNSIMIHVPKALVENTFESLQMGVYKVNSKQLLYKLKSIVCQLFHSNTSNPISKKYFSNLIWESIEAIITNTQIKDENSYYSKEYKKVSDFIEKNYKNDLSMAEIANHFKVTDRTLRNIFMEQVGISPKQFQKAIQINKFKDELLNNPKLNITDIMIRSGMKDHSLISKDFKSYFQVTPTQYKKRSISIQDDS